MTRSGPTTARATGCLALLLVVSLSGCAGLTGFAESQPALPGPDEAADRAASLDTLGASVRTVQHTDEGTVTTVSTVKRRLDPPGYRSRVRSVTANTSDRVYATEGHLTVSNRTTTVLYRPDEERVSYIVDPDREWESPYVDMLAAARENETIRRPTPGVPSLPRAPQGDDDAGGNGSTSYRDQLVRVRYNGTERVDDRRTYRLEVDPVSPNASLKDQTLWLDVEYLYPLERHVEFVAHGDRYEYHTTHRNVTFNPGFSPGTFRLDRDRLPADVEETWFRSYATRDALADNVSMPVPDPAVPEGYELDRANHRSADPTVVSLEYERRGDERPIRISVNSDDEFVSDTGTAVTVGNDTARLNHHDGVNRIDWQADGYAYAVRGPVDNETLVRIARSVAATTRPER
jgi:outer membrane lipoprotein-sorting protein